MDCPYLIGDHDADSLARGEIMSGERSKRLEAQAAERSWMKIGKRVVRLGGHIPLQK